MVFAFVAGNDGIKIDRKDTSERPALKKVYNYILLLFNKKGSWPSRSSKTVSSALLVEKGKKKLEFKISKYILYIL